MSDSFQMIAAGAIGPSRRKLAHRVSEALDEPSFARVGAKQFVVAQAETSLPSYHALTPGSQKATVANNLHARVTRMIRYQLRSFFGRSHRRPFELNLAWRLSHDAQTGRPVLQQSWYLSGSEAALLGKRGLTAGEALAALVARAWAIERDLH